MTGTLWTEGLMIMCIGITFVMSFLCILIIGMIIMSKIVGYLNKIFPEQIFETEKPSKAKAKTGDDEAIAVALAVIRARG